jgi:hypothetical protein
VRRFRGGQAADAVGARIFAARPVGVGSAALRRRASSSSQQKDDAMKLNTALAERTQSQFDAQAIPENHPVVGQLNSLFGDHTFFLDAQGLNIVEPAGRTDAGAQTAQVVKLAGWSDGDRTSLAPHEPEVREVIVVLEPTGPDNAA